MTLKPKCRSTFPESLSCDGLPRIARLVDLGGLGWQLTQMGGCPQLQGCPVGEGIGCCWEQEPMVGGDTPVPFFCRFRTTGKLCLQSLEHGGEPQVWATDTER